MNKTESTSVLCKTLKVVETMFPDNVVAIGTKHRYTKELTVLLDGRIEMNPVHHRRDAFDTMMHFDLYVKRLDDGFYECGKHGDSTTSIKRESPTLAITMMAYLVANNELSDD